MPFLNFFSWFFLPLELLKKKEGYAFLWGLVSPSAEPLADPDPVPGLQNGDVLEISCGPQSMLIVCNGKKNILF